MSSSFSRRHVLTAGLAALGGTIAASAFAADKEKSAESPKREKSASGKSQLSLEALGAMLEAMGFKPQQYESSFNFTFPFKAEGDWNMTMSATMSTDELGIWITAYLSDMPQTSADVPRTALLKLLAQNDELGDGIFFAYIPKVRKIVLERMIPNEAITSASFKESIRELATRVVETQPLWTVSEWKQNVGGSAKDDDKPADVKPSASAKDSKPVKAATNEGASSKKSK